LDGPGVGAGPGGGGGPGGGAQCRVLKPFSSGSLRSLSLEKTARSIRELGLPTFLSQSFLWEGGLSVTHQLLDTRTKPNIFSTN
jgi:hypothetical protein